MNRFGVRENSAEGGERGRWARKAQWRAPPALDRDGDRSLVGGGGWSLGAAGGGGGGGSVGVSGGDSKGWRTEADTDLSDIKATMQRIDGEREREKDKTDLLAWLVFLTERWYCNCLDCCVLQCTPRRGVYLFIFHPSYRPCVTCTNTL